MPTIKIIYNREPSALNTPQINTDDIYRIVELLCSKHNDFQMGLNWWKRKINENIPFYVPLFEEHLMKRGFFTPEALEQNLWRLDFIHEMNKAQINCSAEWQQVLEQTHLDVYAQSLRTIPNTIHLMQHLQHLQFYDNQVSTLPKGIFELENLEFLGLQNNQLMMIPSDINKLSQLQILFVGNNRLSYVSSQIGQLKQLQMLYLNNNNLTKIPSTLGNCLNISFINLAYNELMILPDSLQNLSSLQHLILTGNPLPKAYVSDLIDLMPWCKIEF